jgi:cytochrome c-type biogenesis protein CcmH/NrfG
LLGKVYTLLEKNNEAVKEYSEALKINPLSKEAKEGLNSIKQK